MRPLAALLIALLGLSATSFGVGHGHVPRDATACTADHEGDPEASGDSKVTVEPSAIQHEHGCFGCRLSRVRSLNEAWQSTFTTPPHAVGAAGPTDPVSPVTGVRRASCARGPPSV